MLEVAHRRNENLYEDSHVTSEVVEKFIKPGWYISFTNIKKLGINPHSIYNTPIGIYAYPIKQSWEYYVKKVKYKPLRKGSIFVESIPSFNDASYAWIFNLKPKANIAHISAHIGPNDISLKTYNDKIDVILEFFNSNPSRINPDLLKIFNEEWPKIKEYGPLYIDSLYWRLYAMMKQVYPYIGDPDDEKKDDGTIARPPAILATKVFRLCGIDAIVDEKSHVHSNEPVQTVIFNPLIIDKKILTYNRPISQDIGVLPDPTFGNFKRLFSNKDYMNDLFDKVLATVKARCDPHAISNVMAVKIAKVLGLPKTIENNISKRDIETLSVANQNLIRFVKYEAETYVYRRIFRDIMKSEYLTSMIKSELNAILLNLSYSFDLTNDKKVTSAYMDSVISTDVRTDLTSVMTSSLKWLGWHYYDLYKSEFSEKEIFYRSAVFYTIANHDSCDRMYIIVNDKLYNNKIYISVRSICAVVHKLGHFYSKSDIHGIGDSLVKYGKRTGVL